MLDSESKLEILLSETTEVECGHSLHWMGLEACHDTGKAVCYVQAVCWHCGDILKYAACQMWRDRIEKSDRGFRCDKCNSVWIHIEVTGII